MKFARFFYVLLALSCCCATCKVDAPDKEYSTKHVIIVVVDGPRYTETWGDSLRQYIPFRAQTLLQQGVMLTNFRNEGATQTTAGHTALTTAVYEPIHNGGAELPTYPSFFQWWRKATGQPAEKAWIVASKDKLHVLSNTKDTAFQTKWMPRFDCGVNGPSTGYRVDSITFSVAMDKLQLHHPDLMLINFREPDVSGHWGDWNGYLTGIRTTDQYISELWTFLQTDPYYAGTTALIVTNDHGRHLDGHLDGFVSHGDACEGCRHIEFIAAGPDFKRNAVVDANYCQVDVPRTISEMLGFPMVSGGGKVMREIMK